MSNTLDNPPPKIKSHASLDRQFSPRLDVLDIADALDPLSAAVIDNSAPRPRGDARYVTGWVSPLMSARAQRVCDYLIARGNAAHARGELSAFKQKHFNAACDLAIRKYPSDPYYLPEWTADEDRLAAGAPYAGQHNRFEERGGR